MSANWYEPNKKRGLATNSCLGTAQEQLMGNMETLNLSAKTPAAKLKDLDKVFRDVVRLCECSVDACDPGQARAPGTHPPSTHCL